MLELETIPNVNSAAYVGDIHLRDQEPFYSATLDLFEDLKSSSVIRQQEAVVFLGDLFHNVQANGDLIYVMLDFLDQLKDQWVIVLRGNHDYSLEAGSVIEPLKVLDHVLVLDYPARHNVAGLEVVLLPYLRQDTPLPNGEMFTSMAEVYPQIVPTDVDALFGHFGDETSGPYTVDVDLSGVKAMKVLGHIHKRMSQNYLGSAQISRKDEMGKANYFGAIGKDGQYVEYDMPAKHLDYIDVTFGEDFPAQASSPHILVDIKKAPSRSQGEDFFYAKAKHIKGYQPYLNTVYTTHHVARTINGEDSSAKASVKLSKKTELKELAKRNKVSNPVLNKSLEVVEDDDIRIQE